MYLIRILYIAGKSKQLNIFSNEDNTYAIDPIFYCNVW